MLRFHFRAALSAGLAAVAILATFADAHAAKKPNVLFLFTDDQRADTIAALGNPHIKTPNLDRLVKSGFTFHNAYCMGSTRGAVCLPSRTMLHSGRSLFRLKNVNTGPNFGKSMTAAGYETFHISKRGNTPHALHKGFDHSSYLNDRKERAGGYAGRTAANAFIEFFKSRRKGKPFFAYLGFAGPHDPRGTNAEFRKLYDPAKMPLPANYKPFHPFDNGEMGVRDERLEKWPRTKAAVRKHLFDYYAMISHMDFQIGRIFKTLEDAGEFENTIIVFSSDHGLAIGSHGLFGKQNLYEHSMKSPLIFSGPGIPQGKSDAFAYLFDIYPTVCDLVGAAIPKSLEGKSLRPVIAGRKTAVRDTVFLAYRHVQRAVRRGDWKLIRYPQVNVTQLFNLRDDPYERRNLAGVARLAPKAKELLQRLKAQQKLYADTLPLTVENPKPAKVDVKTFFKNLPVKKRRKRRKKKRKPPQTINVRGASLRTGSWCPSCCRC
ncbi:MAG: sulfatase-like hydrolase/transferase [Planctomycetaceae bacterium]